jgi:hypothetical protein
MPNAGRECNSANTARCHWRNPTFLTNKGESAGNDAQTPPIGLQPPARFRPPSCRGAIRALSRTSPARFPLVLGVFRGVGHGWTNKGFGPIRSPRSGAPGKARGD